MPNQDIFETIRQTIIENPVVLFMKGTAQMPNCGFSGTVVHILQSLGVAFKDVNVLEDESLRQGIKEFSNWPTIPQLYIKTQFIGGCDIVKAMYTNGELVALLKSHNLISDQATL